MIGIPPWRRTATHPWGLALCLALAHGLLALVAAARENTMAPSQLRSLSPPVRLPNGEEFRTWTPTLRFSRTYYVNGRAAGASDENPGTKSKPFRTIGKAAAVLRPGERVVVAAGVYRERVAPARGGTGPDAMIGYHADGAVTIKGSQVLAEPWSRSQRKPPASGGTDDIWAALLPEKYFDEAGENPFKTPNVSPEQFGHMPWATRWRGRKPYTLPCGLVLQSGRRLRQVHDYADLHRERGTFWVTPGGTKLYVRPLTKGMPGPGTIEITVRGEVFAPRKRGLGYIHLKGFTIEHAGNVFPMPQHGAVSVARGHHWVIEDCTVRQVNAVGIDIGVQQYWEKPIPKLFGHHIVRRNTVTDCGVCGIAGLRTTACLIEDNILLRNAFHPVRNYYETGAIKTHHNTDTLIRRNLIVGTLNGPGIWMDYTNVNSRCTRNVLIDNDVLNGAIFIEASARPNRIDHNVIWGTKGNGIYEHDSRGQTIAHNLVARSSGAGICLRGKVTDRTPHNEPNTGGFHRAVNNILVDNKNPVEARGPDNVLAGNLTEGVAVTFDPETLTLTWQVTGKVAACDAVPGLDRDFHSRSYRGKTRWPGPFGKPPGERTTVVLWDSRIHHRGSENSEGKRQEAPE